ncbi:TetR/AcrR family transcriptional regulator [Rhizobium sp. GN54]|uniref:TetR/AcrR family transcriptional regulator n=1 Tax=Rhizobium sp. GN54 TaxID=2898150 RepID=UPI001E5137DB|nr:TetR family transcriptional regulator [Rhizobium sp. GN54]MCD2180764.1 TetR/AcrR family transcriptional regulator [Rhizobium sp. GN54]
MRPTKEQAKENRKRILETAARLFRENGIHAVGVDAVMSGAGLTHGGFYGHFKSKSELADQALADAMQGALAAEPDTLTLSDFTGTYLSPEHRDHAGAGCAIAALGPEMARLPEKERQAATDYIRARIARMEDLQQRQGDAPDRKKAIADLTSLVGALVMARLVNDEALSDEILAAARETVTAA